MSTLDVTATPLLPRKLQELAEDARSLIAASRSRKQREMRTQEITRTSQPSAPGSMPTHCAATPAVVALYLTDLAVTRGLRVSTVQRRASAISIQHAQAGYESPTRRQEVRDLLAGLRRTDEREAIAKSAIGPSELKRLLSCLDHGPNGLRDRSMLLAGFVGGLRRSEIVALNVGDISRRPEGLTVRIRKSKTDQESKGRSIALPYSENKDLCPVRALDAWLDLAEITRGAIFRRIRRGGHIGNERLHAQSVALVIKTTAAEAGLDPTKFSGHSLRRGFVTTAARAGESERSIQRQTGHRSTAVLRSYIEHETAFDDNAAAGLGL